MKIEKINENQIRCTLTKEDLADRDIKISIWFGQDQRAFSGYDETSQ